MQKTRWRVGALVEVKASTFGEEWAREHFERLWKGKFVLGMISRKMPRGYVIAGSRTRGTVWGVEWFYDESFDAHLQSVLRLAKVKTGKKRFLLCDKKHGMRRISKADVEKPEEGVCTLCEKAFGTRCKVVHYGCRQCKVQHCMRCSKGRWEV